MAEPTGKVPVPRSVTALYVLLTDAPVDEDEPAPPVPPASLLLARGTPREDAERAAASPYATPVTREASLEEAVDNERSALAAALERAATSDGLVLDPRVPRLVASTPPVPARAADWFVFEHTDDAVLTHGLVRFAMPELRSAGVPGDRVAMYDAVLVGAAQRLLEEWPDNDPVGPATITMRDIARGYGDASAGGGDPTLARRVDITFAYDSGEHLLEMTLHDDPAEALFAP